MMTQSCIPESVTLFKRQLAILTHVNVPAGRGGLLGEYVGDGLRVGACRIAGRLFIGCVGRRSR